MDNAYFPTRFSHTIQGQSGRRRLREFNYADTLGNVAVGRYVRGAGLRGMLWFRSHYDETLVPHPLENWRFVVRAKGRSAVETREK
jgi:hypothetical protein